MAEEDDRRGELKRRRLQQAFEHARKIMGQDEYDFTYAGDLLSQCVNGEPGNVPYMEAFLANLHKKYNNNRKGVSFAMLSTAPAKSGVKKALGQKDWPAMVKHCVEVFKLNPWDTTALAAMATMCEERGFGECELKYLKSALASNPKDAEINKQCALTLSRRGLFDQAIACWHRVEEAKPNDDVPRKMINELTVQKNRARSGVEEAAARPESFSRGGGDAEIEVTPEQRLLQQIKKAPEQLPLYVELGQMYFTKERFQEAVEVLTKALELSHGDADVQERLYDARVRSLQLQIREAEDQYHAGDKKAALVHKELRKKFKLLDLEVYKFRCERYPNNVTFKYFLGLAHQRLGDFSEAIKQFQVARTDPRRKGECLLSLGQCFQQIKQSRLAMSHYSQAVEEIPDRDIENKKLALYLAGRLALGLEDGKNAEKYLGQLAQLDFAYRDVSSLLDKVEKLGHDGSQPAPAEPE